MCLQEKKLKEIFKPEIIEFLKNNKDQITPELLEEIRSFGNPGKHLALEILDIAKDEDNYYLDAFGNRISFDGNRGLKKAYTKINLFPIHIHEIQRCSDDIHYFKDNYIKIKTPKGVNFPDLREYQNEFIELILPDEHENIAGKMGRQSGKSVSTGIYLSWMYSFNKELNIGIVGNKGAQAREFLNTTKNMLLEIPIWMQQGTTVWNKGSIENESKMRILTDVPSSDAFRGFTISCLTGDSPVEVYDKIDKSYKLISLEEIYSKLDNEFNNRYLIKTQDGYKNFLGVRRTINTGIILKLNDFTEVKCTKNHQILVGKSSSGKIFRKAENLKINHKIKGKIITNIILDDGEKYYYDPVEVQDCNSYISNDITHHNCLVVDEAAFIRSNRWLEFIDSIMPSQSGLAWKKNIIISTMKGMNHWYEITKSASNNKIIEASGDKLVELKNKKYCLLKDYNSDYEKIIYVDISKIDQKTINESLKERLFKEIEIIDDENYKIILTIGTNGFVLYDLDWQRVPRFNSKGALMTPEEFKEQTIAKNGILYFNQNYANEAIGSSHTLISSEKLKEFTSKEPLEIRDGKLKIYAYPEKGHQYICAVDPAKDGQDAFAAQIIDITGFKFKQVASAQLQIDYLLMPEYINDWCEYYNLPYLIIENNEGAGQSIADQMKNDYDYDNLHYDKNDNSNSTNLTKGRKKYPGFRTSSKSRKLILQTMKLFIENNNLEINDKETIKEFFTFILLNNKYQADENCHDDMIMSLALIFAPFCNAKNFDDMKDLIKNLYSEEVEGTETDKSSFTEYLNIGSFDDGTNIDEEYMPKSTWNGYNMEPDGFY